MPINTLQYSTIFQTALDKLAEQEGVTGWMDANAGQVIYNGGNEIKIPIMSTTGLGNYNRDTGYPQGAVTLRYQTVMLTQDRGTKFRLDAMDVNETNFVANASQVMGEFQRTKVTPEIDAYRLAKLATRAIAKDQVKYGYTPSKTTIVEEIKAGIKSLREKGHNGDIVIHLNYDSLEAVELATLGKLQAITFSVGGIDTTVPSIDKVPLIPTASNRMYSKIDILDVDLQATEPLKGGYVKSATALDVNFLVIGKHVPIGVNKQDLVRVFDPMINQKANAWDIDYRRYHDLLTKENQETLIYASIKDAKPQG